MRCSRPDRLVHFFDAFLRLVFEKDLAVEEDYNLADMVSKEVLPATPLALISVTGCGASYRVENLAQNAGVECSSVAMRSQKGFLLADQLADQAIALAARQGA